MSNGGGSLLKQSELPRPEVAIKRKYNLLKMKIQVGRLALLGTRMSPGSSVWCNTNRSFSKRLTPAPTGFPKFLFTTLNSMKINNPSESQTTTKLLPPICYTIKRRWKVLFQPLRTLWVEQMEENFSTQMVFRFYVGCGFLCIASDVVSVLISWKFP